MSGVIFRPPGLPSISEDRLIYFIIYYHSCLKLKWTTIKLYLAGIRFHYLQAGRNNPLCNVERLQCIIRGIKRSQVNKSKPRLPTDVNILYKICCLLREDSEGRMWDLIVSVPDHCLSFYFALTSN